MVCLSVSRKDGCQSMVKILVDDLRPEPRRKKWQKCERLSWKTNDERFTMFATSSGRSMERASEFCRMSSTCGALQQNFFQGWQRSGSLVVQQFLGSTNTRHPHPPYSPDLTPVMFLSSRRWNWSWRGDVLTALKRSRPYRRAWWRPWSEITWRSASDNGNPAGIAVLIPKRIASKAIGEDRNFNKW